MDRVAVGRDGGPADAAVLVRYRARSFERGCASADSLVESFVRLIYVKGDVANCIAMSP